MTSVIRIGGLVLGLSFGKLRPVLLLPDLLRGPREEPGHLITPVLPIEGKFGNRLGHILLLMLLLILSHESLFVNT